MCYNVFSLIQAMSVLSDVEQLNPEQQEAVAYRGGPILVLAGAGTGKTRVIVHRIAGLLREGTPASRILAVTFTNKAADQMRRRIETLAPGQGASVWAHTFHAFSARVLRRHARALGIPAHFTVYDAEDQKRVICEAFKDLGLPKEKNKSGLYANLISRAKDDLLDYQSYSIHAMASRDPFRQTVAKVYELYQLKLAAAAALDFGDLLLKAAELFKLDEAVRQYYQELFLHLLVDEYQDTNHAQYVITKTLAAKHRNLCCVGDPDQSIYQWRGAHIRNILEFEVDFKGTKVVKLEQNYRSTPNILNAATSVIRHNKQRAAKTLWTKKPAADNVEVLELGDEREEARQVTSRILQLLDQGRALGEIAVFYRTNAQSRQFEEALTLAQLPYKVVGSMRFYERKEIKDALAYARAVLNPADRLSFSRILNIPPRGFGKSSQEALEEFASTSGLTYLEALSRAGEIPQLTPAAKRAAQDLVELFNRLSEQFQKLAPVEAMNAALHYSGYWAWLESMVDSDPEEALRLGNLQELLNALQEFSESSSEKPARLGRFLENVALQTGADTYEAQCAVTLMTVHLAKGLEFPVVFLTGLEEGLFPIASGEASPEDLEEERRLCYVGMTRAQERLILTYALVRRLFGRAYSSLPSRFIFEARLAELDMPRELSSRGIHEVAPFGRTLNEAQRTPFAAYKVKKGMKVRHLEFGFGRVLDISGSGEALKVTVSFESGATKKLLLRYAPLEFA